MKNLYLIFLILTTFCFCTKPKKNSEFASTFIDTEYNICELSNYLVADSIDFIIKNTRLIIDQIDKNPQLNEKCIFSLIDSITLLLGSTSNLKYIVAFESFCDHSDGFLSDYLQNKTIQLFENNISIVSNYLYNNRDSKLLVVLIHGYSINIAMLPKDERVLALEKIKNEIIEKLRSSNIDQKIVAYCIKNITNKIDPSIFL